MLGSFKRILIGTVTTIVAALGGGMENEFQKGQEIGVEMFRKINYTNTDLKQKKTGHDKQLKGHDINQAKAHWDRQRNKSADKCTKIN